MIPHRHRVPKIMYVKITENDETVMDTSTPEKLAAAEALVEKQRRQDAERLNRALADLLI